MQKPLVSLICGGLNVERFINQCFTSVLQQTYENVEFIFVNDGSIDRTSVLAENYIEAFNNKGYGFKVIHQDNMGFYPQSGLKVALGKYICTLDADDILLPKSIESRVVFLENNPDFSAVRTNGYIVNEDHPEDTSKFFVTEEQEKIKTNIFEDLLYGKTNNWAGSYMVRSTELFKIYPDKIVPMNRFGQNLQILMPVTYQNKTGFVDEPLMKYIKNHHSFTMSANTYERQVQQAEEFLKIRLSILELLNLNNGVLVDNVNQVYYRIFSDIAYHYKKRSEFNRYYLLMDNKTLQDKINFHKINHHHFLHFFMRIFKFIFNK